MTGRYDFLDLVKTYYLATNDFLAAGGDGYTMLGGAREEGPSMDAAFEEYLKTADLTQYEKINPNSRTISVDSKNFSLPVETPQTNAAASDATTNVPLTYEVAGQFSKKAVVSEKVLPNTGSEQSIFLLLMGMVAGLAGVFVSRKSQQK